MPGWAITLAVVSAYDTWAIRTGHRTMSAAWGRTFRHPIGRPVTVGLAAALVAHLFDPNLSRSHK